MCAVSAIGVIWACADFDDHDYSAFAPEYFVDAAYSPFFYTGAEVYYKLGYGDSSNEQYNSIIVDEWYGHFGKRVGRTTLRFLLLTAKMGSIDSVARRYANVSSRNNRDSSVANLSKTEQTEFFNYLKIAKTCESYTVNNEETWFNKVKAYHSPRKLEPQLLNAFQAEVDPFIKERLWFQLVRYYYFNENKAANINAVNTFNKYQSSFPKNIIYYRTWAYVAGYYYSRKRYAQANYIYSLCFNFSQDQKIPAHWSFHPQNEKDWNETLKLAKTPAEKINLWQLLGMWYDEGRAIKAIYAIDPKSEKLDLLLSRLVNEQEGAGQLGDNFVQDSITAVIKRHAVGNTKLVQIIAQNGNTAKPYYWNLVAGYLAYRDSDYMTAGKFYAAAQKTLPAGDKMLQAQRRILDILLYVGRLKTFTSQNEVQLTDWLNWLADLRDAKIKIKDLRFIDALDDCTKHIAKLYWKQGDFLKSLCFNENTSNPVYSDSNKVKTFIRFLERPAKSPFEKAMLRYYPHNANDLYYHLAIQETYLQKTNDAIAYLKKRTVKDTALYGNPFNGRLVDCHDCDHEAKQLRKFTPLTFLQTLDTLQTQIKRGKDVYKNAYLAANAYYNITYFGNARLFYENDVYSLGQYGTSSLDSLADCFSSMSIAKKYYQLALANAPGAEQKARFTFMLSKCTHNEVFQPDHSAWDYARYVPLTEAAASNAEPGTYAAYFKELKDSYNKTAFYNEAIRECEYFRDYVYPAQRKKK